MKVKWHGEISTERKLNGGGPQGATLIGGHTLEARNESPEPSSLGIQIALCVNGVLAAGSKPWTKGGLKEGDSLLISRALGSGVAL